MSRLETPEEARARLEAEGLGDDERAQLWRRIEDGAEARRRPRAGAWLVGVPVATAALAVIVVLLSPRDAAAPGVSTAKPVPHVDARCALDARAAHLALPADCAAQEVEIDGDHWQLAASAAVEKADGGARVVRGRVRFRVRKRAPGEQFRVGVSHGQVRVVGTVFTVVQREDGGSVAVSEGVIEFVWNDGTREPVRAGETLQWPRPERSAEPAPDEKSPTPDEARAKPTPEVDAEQVIARLLQLRSQRRHDEAVTLLQQTLRTPGLTPVQLERISYELGLSLEAAGRDACDHWRNHVGLFGARVHQSELVQRLRDCTPRR